MTYQFDQLEELAQVELDRFCDGCGYNLRGQSVRRDPSTSVLLSRCPECGRYSPANDTTLKSHPHLQRLAIVMTLGWLLFCAFLFLAELGAQCGICGGIIEEMYWYARWRNDRPEYEFERRILLAIALTGSTFLAFLFMSIVRVGLPHWKRWGYLLLVAVRPILMAMTIGLIFKIDRPNWFNVAFEYIAMFTGTIIVGSLLGFWLGRPVMRLALRIALPSRFRGPFAYLWLVDGKTPPPTTSD